MATVIFGVNIPKALAHISPVSRKLLTSQGNSNVVLLSCRSIIAKSNRDPNYKRIPPFPYKEKNYTMVRSWFDRTTYRFDENSKIIVVDGAVAAGKTKFAKQLAEELDMLYMPEASVEMWYVNSYGYDLRQLDPKLPKACRSFDIERFCKDPHHMHSAFLQTLLYQLKFSQYIDALVHVLNTGQGVVMDKSCYSDFVYAEAMEKEGFISKTAKSVYYDLKRHSIPELMKPHLAIYLDMPVPKILEKVKERGYPHEKDSKALSPSFLTALEENYKRRYLKDIGEHAELLIYDWSDGGDVEVVVEDIERMDFDKYTDYDKKLKDWRLFKEQFWSDKRMYYTNDKYKLMALFNVPRYDCPELLMDGNEYLTYNAAWFSAPGMKYSKGFDPKHDKNVLFKWRSKEKFIFN